jgi:MFS family permease
MIGAALAGPIQEFGGRRASLITGAIVSAAGVAVVYTSHTPGVFLGGKMINGVGLGICLTTGQTYISEITPLKIRGIALSLFTFCMVS